MNKLIALLLAILLCMPTLALGESVAQTQVVDFGRFTMTLPNNAIVSFSGEEHNSLPASVSLFTRTGEPLMLQAIWVTDHYVRWADESTDEYIARILYIFQMLLPAIANVRDYELIAVDDDENRPSRVVSFIIDNPDDPTQSALTFQKHVSFIRGDAGICIITLSALSLEHLAELDAMLDTIVFK